MNPTVTLDLEVYLDMKKKCEEGGWDKIAAERIAFLQNQNMMLQESFNEMRSRVYDLEERFTVKK
jgi:hypothetical protein